MNINGYESLDAIITKGKHPIQIKDFRNLIQDPSILVLDTRNASEFSKGFIPNSVNIGIDGSFAMWVGEMILDINQKIILVTDEGREEECIIRLSRVGYDGTIGYLDGGYEAWKKEQLPLQSITRIEASEINSQFTNWPVVDVRKKSELS